jgi:hypothetical protein
MGKCPERPSPSPHAVVGTFPYNLLNGTAGKRLIMLWGFNRRCPLCHVVVTTVKRGRRVAHDSERESERLTSARPPLFWAFDPER